MTRRNNTRPVPRKVQKPRTRRRRNPRSSNAVLPPAKTLMGHIMRTIVQTAWDIAQGALSTPETHRAFDDESHLLLPNPVFTPTVNGTSWKQWNIDNGWLLAQGWIDRYKGLFKEVKVHKITAHYMPYESATSMGEYIFALFDKDQDAPPSSFSEAIGMPSSVVRKNGQPAKLVWYPTEPEDRNWIDLSSNHIYCSSCLFQAESAYNYDPPVKPGAALTPNVEIVGIEGKVIIDVDASFRGKPSQPKSSVTRCLCKRCIKPVINRLIIASESGSTTPFSSV